MYIMCYLKKACLWTHHLIFCCRSDAFFSWLGFIITSHFCDCYAAPEQHSFPTLITIKNKHNHNSCSCSSSRGFDSAASDSESLPECALDLSKEENLDVMATSDDENKSNWLILTKVTSNLHSLPEITNWTYDVCEEVLCGIAFLASLSTAEVEWNWISLGD